ncbi:hypothetical protein V8C42DRAFT_357276 [Trichoderma barbatum]
MLSARMMPSPGSSLGTVRLLAQNKLSISLVPRPFTDPNAVPGARTARPGHRPLARVIEALLFLYLDTLDRKGRPENAVLQAFFLEILLLRGFCNGLKRLGCRVSAMLVGGLVTAPLALAVAASEPPGKAAPGCGGRSYSVLAPVHRRWIPTRSGRFCGLVSILPLVELWTIHTSCTLPENTALIGETTSAAWQELLAQLTLGSQ